MHGLQANNIEGEVLLRWNDACCAQKMLNSRRKWRKKTGNDVIKSDFYHMLHWWRGKALLKLGCCPGVLYECSTVALDTETAPEMALEVSFSSFFIFFFKLEVFIQYCMIWEGYEKQVSFPQECFRFINGCRFLKKAPQMTRKWPYWILVTIAWYSIVVYGSASSS